MSIFSSNLQFVTTHHGQTPTQAALQTSLFSPELVDIKFWVFSRRVSADTSQLDDPTSFRVVNPLPVYGISLVLLHTEHFRKLLSSGFAESSAESTFYAPYPPEEPDFVDDYDYASDSDLEDESGANYDDWEVEIPQPRIVRQNIAPPQSNSALGSSPSPLAVSEPQVECPVYEKYEEEEDRCPSTVQEASDIYQALMVPQTTHVFAEGCIDTWESGPGYFSASSVREAMTPQPEEYIGECRSIQGSPVFQPAAIDVKRNLGPGAPCRQIFIKHAAFLTFRALIYWLYTGQVSFLPLRNRNPAARNTTTKRLLANRESTIEPPACSPKSMYRLANMLGIAQLEQQALEAIRTSLTPPIILRECLSLFTSNYKAVILMEIQYLCDLYGDGHIKSRWPEAVAYMLSGDCTHADEVVTILLRDRLTPIASVPGRNAGRTWMH